MLERELTKKKIDNIAEMVYKVNGTVNPYLAVNGSDGIKFDEISEANKMILYGLVAQVNNNPEYTSEDVHEVFLDFQKGQGWTYGEEYDYNLKQWSIILPYEELDELSRLTFELSFATIKAFLVTLGTGRKFDILVDTHHDSNMIH